MLTTIEPRRVRLWPRHTGAKRILAQHERTTIVIAGRKFQKTSNLVSTMQIRRLLKGQQIITVAPVYDQVMESWREIERADEGGVFKFSLHDRVISCPATGGVCFFRSMDKPENVRAKNAALIIADEVQGISREDYDRVVLPIGLAYDVEEFLVGTANGHDWVHEYGLKIAKLPGGHYWRIPTRGYRWDEDGRLVHDPHPMENDRIPFERLVHYADRLSRDAFDQEIGAKLVAKAGRVYSDFQRDRHMKPLEYDESLDLWLAVDPGLVVCAVGFYQVRDEDVHKIGEATLRDRTPEQAIEIVRLHKSGFDIQIKPEERLATVGNLPSDWVKRLNGIAMDPQANARDQQTAQREVALWENAFGMRPRTSSLPKHKNPEWRAAAIKNRQFSASGRIHEYIDPCCEDSAQTYEQLAWNNAGRIPDNSPYKHHSDERGYFEVARFHMDGTTVYHHGIAGSRV